MSALRAGLVYFLLVFGAGFVLGVARTLLVVPRIGAPMAELLETPLMLVAIWFAANWLVRRTAPGAALPAGLLAFTLTLAADTAVGVFLRRMTLAEVFFHREPLNALAYYGSLLVFGFLPAILAAKHRH
jgi:hypothetical protein